MKTTPSPMAATWQHLDAICVGSNDAAERSMLVLAEQAVEAVRADLMSMATPERTSLAVRLGLAVQRIRTAAAHLDDVVAFLGEHCQA